MKIDKQKLAATAVTMGFWGVVGAVAYLVFWALLNLAIY